MIPAYRSHLPFSSKNTPFRAFLIVPFVMLIVMAVGLTGYLSFSNGRQAVNEVAAQLAQQKPNLTVLIILGYTNKMAVCVI